MLQIHVPENELFNEETGEFIIVKEQDLLMEHSLISLAKWESKWTVPFLSTEMTDAQVVDYMRCMTITKNVDPNVFYAIPNSEIAKVNEYINAKMTATWFNEEENGAPSREIITAELIYNWMIEWKIPFECQKWHLNRLLTLIRVRSIKSAPPKKMRKSEIYARNRKLNEARRKRHNTRG